MKPCCIRLIMLIGVLLLLMCVMGPAQAKDDNVSADQDLAMKKGELGSKEIDASKLPGTLEYAIVIGSVIAAIGVVKFA